MRESTPASPSGLWVPIVTPMTDTGAIDEAGLARLARRLLADGVDGLVALGTTGEPATLEPDERRRVVDICASACDDAGAGLMVGAGTNSTAATIEEARRLTDGVDAAAVLVVVPYYTRPSTDAVVEHFGLVADAVPLPVVMYNIPYRTGRGLDADDLIAAGAHDNVVGLKQSVGALDADTLALLATPDRGFDVLAGDDAFIAPTVLMGGSGAIAAAAHLCTPMFVAMVRAARAGEVATAAALAGELLAVVTAGFAEPSPAVWKGALVRRGELASGMLRRPMTEAPSTAVDALVSSADRAAGRRPAEAHRRTG